MTSPNLDTPILYGYLLGDMISCHDGVRCYPAIRRETEEKFILKVISIPASASKLDALLLTGALADRSAALVYFKDLAKDLVRQADFLRELSQQEGFVPYLDSDILPMEDMVGYNVCLLGTYKQSLESILKTEALTHADIINMGLDLCAALAACRRAGMLYADLKPGNVFYDPEQGCRIGDVGFIALSSLKYTSLPDKYRSSYTAPELSDDFAVLNSTVDIFALGMVLYQAYNGGVLPFSGAAPAQELPSPLYADYEMAQIIARACHPEPSQRWQDPTQLAQALIGYMQQYGASEIPIIPPAVDIVEPEEAVEEFLPEADPQQLQQEMAELQDEEADAMALLSDLVDDETAPSEESAAEVSEDVLSEDLCAMLAQADELIAHELPQPPVAPEPVPVPMPEPIVPEEVPEPEAEPEAESQPEAAPEEPREEPAQPSEEESQAEEPAPAVSTGKESHKKPFRIPKQIVIAVLLILLTIGIVSCGRHYYDNIYTLHIDSMVLENTLDTLTVQVATSADESLLRVICSDSYGNSQDSAVVNGIAQFQQLNPNTRYTVRIIASGKHRLTGHITDTFTTPAQTTILSFIAAIGPEDCSVVLSFTVDGPETGNWVVRYSAEGITEQTHAFTGRSTIIYGLTDGAEYTFTLTPETELNIAGATQVTYRATNILYAKNLQIIACGEGSLTAQWQQPDNGTAKQWRVRCYNNDGYDVSVITDQCTYTFTELTHSSPCTVEITAVGMNRSVSTSIPADPITVNTFDCTITEEMGLLITWDYSGHTPEGGWCLRYSIDGGTPTEIRTEETALLLMLLPGSEYRFTIIAEDGSYVFGAEHSFTASDVEFFSGFGLTSGDLQAVMCLWPEEDEWDWAEILQDNYRISFTYGETAAIMLRTDAALEASENPVNIQFVINSAEGTPLRMDSATMIWNGMWQNDCCCLLLPYLPQVPGSYTLILYFDGQFVARQEFTVV